MEEKKKIYVLIYSYDDCDCQWSDTIMGSRDKKLLEEYKKKIERNSATLREAIDKIAAEKRDVLKPLLDRANKLINKKLYNKSFHKKEWKELSAKMTVIHREFNQKRNKLLSEMAMSEDNFIEDTEIQSLEIGELPMLD